MTATAEALQAHDLNWPDWRLEHWAAVESKDWPSRYMPGTRLSEAVWHGLNYGEVGP